MTTTEIDWSERFKKVLKDYLITVHGMDIAEIHSTSSDYSEGCETCGWGDGWDTYIYYTDNQGNKMNKYLDINLNALLSF
jgi:hypothetical protein